LKTLVTGSTGFIGSAITRQLVSDGAEVKVLVRETSDTRNIDGLLHPLGGRSPAFL
jgi:dihydroflavonol-4-reductase